MKLPSEAQARLLSCVEGHQRDGEQVFAGNERDAPSSTTSLYVERLGSEVPPRETLMSVGLGHYAGTDILLRYADIRDNRHRGCVRGATVNACTKRGWLDATRTREITTPCLGVAWKSWGDGLWTVDLNLVDITDDGRIALGLWRQRKLAASADPSPRLEGRDRAVMDAALTAELLGFVLAPMSKQARADARRLAREGWGARGMIGASVSSLQATPMSLVEVRPDLADARLDRGEA